MKKTLLFLFSCALLTGSATAQTINASPYCLPNFDPANNATSDQNYIYEVKLGTFDNVTNSLFSHSSYVFYNNLAVLPIHVVNADLINFVATMQSGNPTYTDISANVFIDYNHNNVFDSAEEVYSTNGYTSAASLSIPIPIPTTSVYGNTRMRIQWIDGLTYGPCQLAPSDNYGAVADYTVTVPDTYPLTTTTFASLIHPNDATLNGLINANNISASADSFEYGLNTGYGTTVAAASVWSMTDSTVNTMISGLMPNTTYHYRVKGTNSYGTNYGRDTTFTTTFETGIVNEMNHLQINVYPNPVTDVLHIDNLKQGASYSIQNIAGTTMKKGTLQAGNNRVSINALPSGNYILEVYNSKGEKNTIKLVK